MFLKVTLIYFSILLCCCNTTIAQTHMIVDTVTVFDSKIDNFSDVAVYSYWFVSERDFSILDNKPYLKERNKILSKYQKITVECFPCNEEHSCLPHDYCSIIIDSIEYNFRIPYPMYSVTKESFKKRLKVDFKANRHSWAYSKENLFINFYYDHQFIERLECLSGLPCGDRYDGLIDVSNRATVEVINNLGDKIVMHFELRE